MKFKVIGIFIFLLLLGANPVQAQSGGTGGGTCIPPACIPSQMLLMVEEAKAKLKLEKTNRDKVKVEGEFWLGTGNDDIAIGTNVGGLRFIDEEVTVTFDGRADYEQSLPAGSLVETDLENHFEYDPVSPTGPYLELEIEYVPTEFHGKFEAKWKRRDLMSGTPTTVESSLIASDPLLLSPVAVPFDLDIGNDNGVVVGINFRLEKDKVDKRVYEYEQEEEEEDEDGGTAPPPTGGGGGVCTPPAC